MGLAHVLHTVYHDSRGTEPYVQRRAHTGDSGRLIPARVLARSAVSPVFAEVGKGVWMAAAAAAAGARASDGGGGGLIGALVEWKSLHTGVQGHVLCLQEDTSADGHEDTVAELAGKGVGKPSEKVAPCKPQLRPTPRRL